MNHPCRYATFAFLLASMVATPVLLAQEKDDKSAAEKDKKPAEGAPPKEESSITDHTIKLGGQTISYKATAQTTLLKDDKGEPAALLYSTAYTRSEGPHSNGIGSRLQCSDFRSAAADWSRFPVGTKFTILESGRNYMVDDYGSAVVGTNTIDLYVPTRSEMNRWGVRKVTISITELGSYAKSLEILRPRRGIPYVRKMVENLERQR